MATGWTVRLRILRSVALHYLEVRFALRDYLPIEFADLILVEALREIEKQPSKHD
jgi:hypothetical protein